MGLRSVTLGHAYPRVVEAVPRQRCDLGTNFIAPGAARGRGGRAAPRARRRAPTWSSSRKNGSDVDDGGGQAGARGTGRDLVAICGDQPFFSTDDWFIGTTPMPAGIPQAMRDLDASRSATTTSTASRRLFAQHPGQIACLILEPATAEEPAPGFLEGMRELLHGRRRAAHLRRDDHRASAGTSAARSRLYGVAPDLATFGKAMAQRLRGLGARRPARAHGARRPRDTTRARVPAVDHPRRRDARARRDAAVHRDVRASRASIERLTTAGERLRAGSGTYRGARRRIGFFVLGRPCNLVFATLDADGTVPGCSARCSSRS